jgi:hypothetical protein
LEVSKGI